MRKFLVSILLAATLTVGGCAQLRTALDIATAVGDASVPPTAVIVAASAFDAVEVTATNYLRLRRCTASSGPVCRDPRATVLIVPAVRSGRDARNALKRFLRDNPGKLGPGGLYSALISATSTLQAIYAHYQVGK